VPDPFEPTPQQNSLPQAYCAPPLPSNNASASTPANGTDGFKIRGLLLGIGITLAVFSAIRFILYLISQIYIMNLDSGNGNWGPLFLNMINPLVTALGVLILISLAVCGVLLLSEGSRLKRAALPAKWCTVCGIADIVLAVATTLVLLRSVIGINGALIVSARGIDAMQFNMITAAVNIPAWLLEIVAGILFLVASKAQKETGRAGAALTVAGIVLIIYPILIVILRFILSALLDYTVISPYITNILTEAVLLLGLVLLGIAPASFPRKTKVSPHYASPDVAPPNTHGHYYATDPAAAVSSSGAVVQYGDAPSGGFAVLSFFIPIVGLILWLVWKDQYPKKAKSCGKGALIGAIVSLTFSMLYVCIVTVFTASLYQVV
jgi:hypothetical protein